MMKNAFTIAGALSGAIAVMLGAFTAHGLKSILTDDQLRIFHTGVEYQFYHTVALIITGIVYSSSKNKPTLAAGYLFLFGIIFFSGSLYLLATNSSITWVGAITPLGGLCFIAGWILLAYSFIRTTEIKNPR